MASILNSSLNHMQRRILAEWRGVEEPPDLSGHEHDLSRMLQKFLTQANLQDRLTEEDLDPIWATAVGEFNAQHSKALSFENGILYVAILQPSIHYTLQRELRSRILPKLKSALPGQTIRNVKFRLG